MWAPFKFQINRSSSLFSRLDLVAGWHDDWRRCCCRRIWRYLLNSGGDSTTASTGDRPTVLCSRWWTTRGSVPRRSSRTEELALADSATERQSCLWGPTAKTCNTCLLLKVWSERQLSKQHAGFISCCRFRSPSIDSLLRGGVYKLLEILPCSRWKTNPVFFFSFLFFLVFTTFSSSFRRICNLITFFSRDKEKGPDKMFRELNVQSF